MILYLNPVQAAGSKESAKVEIIVRPILRIERKAPNIAIRVGESEFTKREKQTKQAKRNIIVREQRNNVMTAVYDLGALRALYQEAAAKFSIDWRLIEAVHQVESGKSADTCKSSYAGAIGPMQFLPSTFRYYANEGNNICALRDSVFAAANLLSSTGAAEGDIDSALFSYNHSKSYVELVKSIMNSI